MLSLPSAAGEYACLEGGGAGLPGAGCGKASIALLAYNSLGDGLIYLMMAENLLRNGFAVTYFGDVGHQLRHWVPQLETRPSLHSDSLPHALEGFDLVIMSPPAQVRTAMNPEVTDKMRRQWLLVCQKAPIDWRYDLTETKRQVLPEDRFAALRGLLDCGGSIRDRPLGDESVVDITLDYMRRRMGLEHLSRSVPLSPPSGLVLRAYPRRIVVSPDSAGPEKKEWAPESFLRLCQRLCGLGYDPKIVVAPSRYDEWRARVGNRFEMPRFKDIGELGAYLYESGAVIANDSGNGHLASFLGVPVVTIYRKRNARFHWRPDWLPAKVVCPRFTLPGPRGAIWRPFISENDIVSALPPP